ncbi:SphA family protein [Pararhodospirillum oryzae]|uniref:Phenol degradation protein n=1 Tax=Pararhodospirillum oryzae TaxID=478448 RepID=A0A512H7Y5_9PROT|nr:transporter [Pararhodospirillum oryzae]GEO81554.1 phenol degradation protein [Pararhodospirillum oryzae]
MKKIILATALTGTVALSGQASAMELWDPHLRGVNEGLAAGALPPKGVYFMLNNYWASYQMHDASGNKIHGTNLSALVEVPALLWSTGWKVLGADYAMAIAQPITFTDYEPQGHGSGNWGFFNTMLIPGQLSWAIDDFHIKTGLTIYLDDASTTPADLVRGKRLNGGLPSGNGYTAVQPDLGISWLHDGWNLSADMHLTFPVDSTNAPGYEYHSGDQFSADYTATKTLDKWTLGLGAHQQHQLNRDTLNGAEVRDSIAANYGLGPIVGYQFGGLSVMATWNHTVYSQNDVADDFVNVRFVAPLF